MLTKTRLPFRLFPLEALPNQHIQSLHAVFHRRETWGQLIGSYVVVEMMFSAGVAVAAALVAYRLVFRHKLDGFYIHVIIQHIMSAVWWSHNHVLAHVFGRGS